MRRNSVCDGEGHLLKYFMGSKGSNPTRKARSITRSTSHRTDYLEPFSKHLDWRRAWIYEGSLGSIHVLNRHVG